MITRRDFCLSFGAALLLPKQIVVAQKASVFLTKIYKNSRGETMPYRLFVPHPYNKRRKYPLVLWLHGGAGRGNDNVKQVSGGNTIGSHVWTRPENQSTNPCFVVAPQCPDNESWASLDTARPTPQLQIALEILQHLQRTESIDSQRLYVAGQSLGGFGTWSAISHHPKIFAAAVPICGGGNESEASNLTRMPIWAFHGEADEAVSVERSRRMIAAVKAAGGMPKYTEYQGAGHVIWERVFNEPELLPWVFAQTRAVKT